MFTDDGTLKIIDFGLARQIKPFQDNLTPYVQTRWYRAPELLFCAPYSFKVDIWAVGCIAAEMVIGTPLFKCDTDMAQLQDIASCLGGLPKRFATYIELLEQPLLHVGGEISLSKRCVSSFSSFSVINYALLH